MLAGEFRTFLRKFCSIVTGCSNRLSGLTSSAIFSAVKSNENKRIIYKKIINKMIKIKFFFVRSVGKIVLSAIVF